MNKCIGYRKNSITQRALIFGMIVAAWSVVSANTWEGKGVALGYGLTSEQYNQFPELFDHFTLEAMEAYGDDFDGWVCNENDDTGGEDCHVIHYDHTQNNGDWWGYGGYDVALFYDYGSAFSAGNNSNP